MKLKTRNTGINYLKKKLRFRLERVVLVLILCSSCGNIDLNKTSSKAYSNPNGRNDQWGFIGPGGGGAMFYPAINPSDADNIFVSCDMTGSFVTYDGGEKWRMFNLRGVTKFYAFDTNNANVVYAGTSNMLFKSKDKGVSWHTLYPRPKDIVAIHAQGDHAQEVVVTKDSIITRIEKLAVDPDNPQRLFLLTRKAKIDIWPETRGKNGRHYIEILISENGGKAWKLMDKIPFDLNNIFVDPTSPLENRTVYVSGKDGLGVKKNGKWGMVELPSDIGAITQYADGVDSKTKQHIIYALSGRSYFNPEGKKDDSRIYVTHNGGQDWDRIDDGLQSLKIAGAESPEYRSMATSYTNPETLYVSYANLKIAVDTLSFGVAKSTDFGKSWQLVWQDKMVEGGRRFISSPNRSQGWLDQRFGPEWGENPFHMAVDENNPLINYATDFGRTIKTLDGGETWEQVYTNAIQGGGWKTRGLQVTTGYMLAFDPFDSLHVFMADTDTGLMESFDGGKSWASATHNNGVPKRWVNSTYWLLFDPDVKGKVWAVMSANHDLPRPKMWRNRNMDTYRGGILLSLNGGKTWKPVSNEVGEIAPTYILMDKKSDSKNKTLYVCAFGKGVYKSTDDGVSWELKNKGILGNQPAAWRMVQKDNGDLFLVVSRKSDDGSIGNEMDGALYRSTDGAETWHKVNLPKGVNAPTSLIIDPKDQNRLILSAWGRYGATEFSADRGGGIYVSADDGATWKAVLTKDQHIHDITVDGQHNLFYAVGFNSSAYSSADRGESWERIKGYNFKWGKRVQPDPNDPDKVYIITFGGGVWHGPSKGDEEALEDIVTPVASYNN